MKPKRRTLSADIESKSTIDFPLKFVVFAYDSCYPVGGMNDIVASFDALETAIAFLDICKPDGAHIVDKTSFAIVHEL